MLTFSLFVAFSVTSFVYLIKFTDFVPHYANLFNMGRIFYSKDFFEWQKTVMINSDTIYYHYVDYLREIHSNNKFTSWFYYLISCPFCLTYFSCFIISLFWGIHLWLYFSGISILTLFLFLFLQKNV